MALGRFKGGSGRRAIAHTRPALLKISSAQLAFPELGGASDARPINLPLFGGKSLGGWTPEVGVYIPARSTPQPGMADQGATYRPDNQPMTVKSQGLEYLLVVVVAHICFSFVWLANLLLLRGVRGVMVIVVGIGHGDTSSNPRPDWLLFT